MKETMDIEFLNNAETRVWIEADDRKHYCGRTAAFRIIFEKGKATILLYERLMKNETLERADLLNFATDGVNVLITYVEVGRPDVFGNNRIIIAFNNCSVQRSWLTRMSILESEHQDSINFFIKLISSEYKWKK
jgi:hypothetical protein